MRTALLTCLAVLALAACGSSTPFNPTTAGAGASTGESTSGAGATGTTTGGAATGTGDTGTTGGTTGTGAGAASSSGTTTGPGVTPGTLWIGGAYGLDPTALGMSATNPPYTYNCPPVATLASPAQGGAEVMDGLGQLWTQFYTSAPSDTISAWAPSELVDGCTSHHPALLFNISQSNVANLAFDGSGNLWASAPQANIILGYGATSLQASGSLGAAYELAQNPNHGTATIFNPTGLAFDSLGTLWVGNYYSILGYHTNTLAQAATNGTGNELVPPDIVLTNPAAANVELDGGLYNQYVYQYLAFDSSGDLWVTVQNNMTVPTSYQIIEFSQTQMNSLATNNMPTPIFTINETNQQQNQPPPGFLGWSAIAFDASGNLWAGAHLAAPNLYRFPAATLTGSGTPDIIITAQNDTNMVRGFSLAFDPIPPRLPLRP